MNAQRDLKQLRPALAQPTSGTTEPEKRLRQVIQDMPVMMDAFDAEGIIIVWNRECERVTGYTSDEIVGNPHAMEALYPAPAYRQRMMAEWKERGDDYRDWEWNIISKDGSTKTVAWSNLSSRFPVRGWATWGIGVDVTDARQAFEKVLSKERRYEMLVEALADVVYNLDTEGNVTFISEKVRDVFGLAPEEIIGRNFVQWIPKKDLAAMQELFQQVMGGRKVRAEIVIVDNEGQLRDVELRSQPLIEKGELKGTLGVFSDISKSLAIGTESKTVRRNPIV